MNQEHNNKNKRTREREHRMRHQPKNVTAEKSDKGEEAASLTKNINVVAFAEARVTEINSMIKAIESHGGRQRVFQKIPRHMRRRPMSHNVKRLPRRLRKIAEAENEKAQKSNGVGGKPKAAKSRRKSRKHRRLAGNLLEEYSNRKRQHGWLETHIWHAKRFKMEKKWGYCIPVHPSDKGQRAIYRAVANHCAIQDLSYYSVLELSGSEQEMCLQLARVSSSEIGKTFLSKSCLNGSFYGSTLLYAYDGYPLRPLCPVEFLWQPVQNMPGEDRHLWLWIHPVAYEAAYQELCKLGQGSEGKVRVMMLKDEIVRFRLQGPSSHAVAVATLQSACVDGTAEKDGGEPSEEDYWWKDYFTHCEKNAQIHQQSELWEKLSTVGSVTELPTRSVVCLTVADPRTLLPAKKTQARPLPENNSPMTESADEWRHAFPEWAAQSPLWDRDVRGAVSTRKLSQAQVNSRREDHLVPGSQLELGDQASRVPLTLLQRPGTLSSPVAAVSPLGFGQGWDLLLPARWAMPFWVALVYRGARPYGEREAESLAFMEQAPQFPQDYPDTPAGQAHAQALAQELHAQYHRHPPDKRPSYPKLGVAHPFLPPWQQLLGEWSDGGGGGTSTPPAPVEVVRSKGELRALSRWLELGGGQPACARQDALVYLWLDLEGRGVPGRQALVCLPSQQDLQQLARSPGYGGPLEPLHKQPRPAGRAQRRALRNECGAHCGSSPQGGQGLVDWCSRRLVGLVCRGHQCFSSGRGHGLALCAVRGLAQLTRPKPDRLCVLVRNINSRQYRFAHAIVLI